MRDAGALMRRCARFIVTVADAGLMRCDAAAVYRLPADYDFPPPMPPPADAML